MVKCISAKVTAIDSHYSNICKPTRVHTNHKHHTAVSFVSDRCDPSLLLLLLTGMFCDSSVLPVQVFSVCVDEWRCGDGDEGGVSAFRWEGFET